MFLKMDYSVPSKQVVFIVEGKKLYCDRSVARRRSRLVRSLVNDFKEDAELEVDVTPEISHKTMIHIITLMYDGYLDDFVSNVRGDEARTALRYFQIDLRNTPSYIGYVNECNIIKVISSLRAGLRILNGIYTPEMIEEVTNAGPLPYEKWLLSCVKD
jgi:hypothetical protein